MKLKKILLIQFRTDESAAHEKERILRAAKNMAELRSIDAISSHISWQEPENILKDFDGVILGAFSKRGKLQSQRVQI